MTEAASAITVILEDVDAQKLTVAREAVGQANVLCFLGFAYAIENLQRLDLPAALMLPKAAAAYGSAFDLLGGEQALTRRRLNSRIELGHPTIRCREFLREHEIVRA